MKIRIYATPAVKGLNGDYPRSAQIQEIHTMYKQIENIIILSGGHALRGLIDAATY